MAPSDRLARLYRLETSIDILNRSYWSLNDRIRFLENTLAGMGYGTSLDPRRPDAARGKSKTKAKKRKK
jgi:hypothetical protein